MLLLSIAIRTGNHGKCRNAAHEGTAVVFDGPTERSVAARWGQRKFMA